MIYVVGKSTDRFQQLDQIRKRFLVDEELKEYNLNSKNDMYCECVALYHMWKNCDDYIVGIEHYRRNFLDIFTNKLLGKNAIEKYFLKYDVILTYKNRDPNRENLRADLSSHIGNQGVEAMLAAIQKLYGEQDLNFFSDYLSRREKNPFNLFITRNPIMKSYASWYFRIIDNLTISMPKRSYGYISEFLLGGFVEHKGFKVKEIPFIMSLGDRSRIGSLDQAFADNYK